MPTNALEELIRQEIRRRGPISFARFMELALFAPELGYYERQLEIGRRGDFFTSVSVGPVFGELLAFQFAQWWDTSCPNDRLQLVEAGAHRGALAGDILGWFARRRPELLARLDYCLIEPSPKHREWQKETLREWLPRARWVNDISDLIPGQDYRIIFSNELLDAMPFHRLAWNAPEQKWREWVVALNQENFSWRQAAPASDLVEFLPEVGTELAAVLPSDYTVEVSPVAIAWWKKAVATLRQGRILTIDYGLTEDELFRPERGGGTARAFIGHHFADSLLEAPGQSDLTAHIHFSAIEAAGKKAGLQTEAFFSQSKFLTEILAQTEALPGHFEPWTPQRLKQFKTLTHPEHLGRPFRVLIQQAR